MTWAPNLKKARPLLGMISFATVHHGLNILGQTNIDELAVANGETSLPCSFTAGYRMGTQWVKNFMKSKLQEGWCHENPNQIGIGHMHFCASYLHSYGNF